MAFWTAARLREALSTFPDDLPIEVEIPDEPGPGGTAVSYAVTGVAQSGRSVYLMCDYQMTDDKGREWTHPNWSGPKVPEPPVA